MRSLRNSHRSDGLTGNQNPKEEYVMRKQAIPERPILLETPQLSKTLKPSLFCLAALAMLILAGPRAILAQVNNTTYGSAALASNTTGSEDSAFGANALRSNNTGSGNTAIGWDALYFNTHGQLNTATGQAALEGNTLGIGNTATGIGSLANNGTGNQNVAMGWNALYFNSGNGNTAIGAFALQDNSLGANNIGLGIEAGIYLTTGSNNIMIGNPGVAAEANAIQIGTEGVQTSASIAGIFDSAVTEGCSVVVASSGQLGCLKSSARYKHDVQDMGAASEKLMKLRPVTFVYKTDQTNTLQYGLIAEEVEKVFPEMVIRGADGTVETVAYQMLPAMLLNEVQKQAQRSDQIAHLIGQKDKQIASLEQQAISIQKQNAQMETIAARLEVLERRMRTSDTRLLASASH
jgi:Chaperone of endosialidase